MSDDAPDAYLCPDRKVLQLTFEIQGIGTR